MIGLLTSIGYLAVVVALAIFLGYRLKLNRNRQVGGAGFLYGGLIFIFLGAVINLLQHFSGYPTWFLQNIYGMIDIIEFLFLTIGAILFIIGLALYFSYFGDRDLEVSNHLEKLKLLDNLQQESRSPFPVSELLERALKTLMGGLGEEAGAIFLLNRSQRQFVLTTASGLSKEEVALLEYYPFGRNLVTQAVEDETAMLSADFRSLGGKAQLAVSRFHSIIVLPLISGKNKQGALLLFSEEEKRYSREYLSILTPIVEWLSEKIEVNRLGRDLGRSQRELESRKIRLEDFNQKLNRIVKHTGEVLTPASFAERCLGLVDADEVWLLGLVDGRLNILGGSSESPDFSESLQAALLNAIPKNKPVILNQEGSDESGNSIITRSSILLPAGNRGQALLLRNSGGAMALGEDDLRLLEIVSGMAGLVTNYSITRSASDTRSRGYETIARVLKKKIVVSDIEKEIKTFVEELKPVFSDQSIYLLYRREGDKFKVIYSSSDLDLSEISISQGEGIPGQASILKGNEARFGVSAVNDALGQYDEENHNILLNLLSDHGNSTFHSGYSVITNDRVDYFISLFGFDSSTVENTERHRLISVLVGLFNLRLEIGQAGHPKETGIEPSASASLGFINELNNELAAISGYCQLVRRDPNLSGEIASALEAILKSSDKMAQRIKTSPVRGNAALNSPGTDLDINTLIKELLSKNKISGNLFMIGGRPFEVNLKLGDIPLLPFDKAEFSNFLDSVQRVFTQSVSEEEIITISTYESKGHIYLDISRHRKNFPPVEPVSGFGRFSSPSALDDVLKNAEFMERLGRFAGEFAFDKYSQVPSYYSFRFVRPVGPVEISRKKLPGELTILAVDDQVVILELLAAMCQSMGYRILTARNGKDGLSIFKTHQPDIVIADLVMPGMSGLELAAQVKGISPSTPIIMITGWGVSVDKRKLEEAGVNFLLNKPFRLEQLSDILNRVKLSGVNG